MTTTQATDSKARLATLRRWYEAARRDVNGIDRPAVSFTEAVEATRETYDDELDDLERFAIVEEFDGPGSDSDGRTLLSTIATEDEVEKRLAGLYDDMPESSFRPTHVVDLDSGEELEWCLSVKLERPKGGASALVCTWRENCTEEQTPCPNPAEYEAVTEEGAHLWACLGCYAESMADDDGQSLAWKAVAR